MVEMGKSGAQAEVGPVGASSTCCKVVPGMPVSMFTPTTPRLLTEVMLIGTTIAAHIPSMPLHVAEAGTPPLRYLRDRSQSILCNFRI
jgi:hypothetical protein